MRRAWVERRRDPQLSALPRVPVRSRPAYLLATLALGLCCELMQLLVGLLNQGRPLHDVALPIDARIAVMPASVWAYDLWAPFLLLPAAVGMDAHRVNRSLLAALGACLSAYVLFLAFPVHVAKAELGDGLSERALAAVYAADRLHVGAYLPSIHVATAWIAAVATLRQGLPRVAEALVVAIAAAITASTLLTKQHVIADVALGLLWASLWWGLAERAYPELSGGASDPGAAARVLFRRAGSVAAQATVRCILLPAAAWWAAGRLASAHGPSGPASAGVALPLLAAGAAGLVTSRCGGGSRHVRDTGLAMVFVGIALREGDAPRAAIGGALLLLSLSALPSRSPPA